MIPHTCGISAPQEPGFDWVGAAYSGITSMGGEKDGSPLFAMVALGDVSTGAHAMGAICAALLYRERTGRGQRLDLSLLDTYAHYHEASFQMYSLSKGAITPTRSGAHSWYACPAGVFKGRERYLIIIAPLEQPRLPWRHLPKFGQRRIQVIPRLGAGGINVSCRPDPAGVIHTSGIQHDQVRPRRVG